MIKKCENIVIPIEQSKPPKGLKDHTDDELMQLAQADLKEAFAELVRRYQAAVRGYCRKWAGQRGDDLAQDIFVRLWRAKNRYRPQNEFKAYLFMIMVNRCRNDKRGLSRKPPMEPLNPEKPPEAASADQLERILKREKLSRVHRQIQQLSPKLREALLLRFGNEMSYREIAEITKVNETTIRSRVMLGIKKLKKEL